jgi:hypothetical protein
MIVEHEAVSRTKITNTAKRFSVTKKRELRKKRLCKYFLDSLGCLAEGDLINWVRLSGFFFDAFSLVLWQKAGK